MIPSGAVFFMAPFVTFLTENRESISFPVYCLPSVFSWHFLISMMANPQIFSFMVSAFDFAFRKLIYKNSTKIYPFVFWYFYCFSLTPSLKKIVIVLQLSQFYTLAHLKPACPPLPQSIPTLLSVSMGPSYMLFDQSFPCFPPLSPSPLPSD